VVPLLRERGDSGHVAVAHVLPAFAEVSDAAWRNARWRVLYHDRAMQEALLGTEGGVGPFDLGAIVSQRLPLRALAIDGIPAGDPRYPFEKELAFVHRPDARPEALAFVRFATSPRAAEIAAELGYRPGPPGSQAPATPPPAPPAEPPPGPPAEPSPTDGPT
jgi:phosphate transport system substrate-binding protein